MSIKQNIKEYFSYSSSEKRGLLVLLVLLGLVLLLPEIIQFKSEQVSLVSKNRSLDSLLAVLKDRHEPRQELFSFDPNFVSAADLKKLGLREKPIQNLVRYREKGGKFKSVADFSKIYGITQTDYERLKDCILIAKTHPVKRKSTRKEVIPVFFDFDPNNLSAEGWRKLGVNDKVANRIQNYLHTGARFGSADDIGKIYGFNPRLLQQIRPYVKIESLKREIKKKVLIDLNTADSLDLQSVKGIGKVLSSRILKYKNLLGGYTNPSQLKEVYGISENLYQEIKTQVKVSVTNPSQLSINKHDENALSKHPYISKRVALSIVKYRINNGNFTSVQELRSKKLVSDSTYKKLSPYIKL